MYCSPPSSKGRAEEASEMPLWVSGGRAPGFSGERAK